MPHLIEPLERRDLLTAVRLDLASAVHESDKSALFVVSIDAPLNHNLAISYVTAGETATAKKDFTTTKGLTWIPAGQTTVGISVPLVHDNVFEGDETFRLNITFGGGHSLFARATIIDSQSAPTFRAGYVTYQGASGNTLTNTADGRGYVKAPASGKRTVFADVLLAGPSSTKVTLNYQTGDLTDTAIAGTDYLSTVGTVTFKPGQVVAHIPITILANPTDTLDRDLTILLTPAVGGATTGNALTKTITIAAHLANGKTNPAVTPPALVPIVIL